jgi:CBS domain-containing protein
VHVGALPVVDEEGKILGVCSYIDILRALSASAGDTSHA